jgi:hypothetical protein
LLTVLDRDGAAGVTSPTFCAIMHFHLVSFSSFFLFIGEAIHMTAMLHVGCGWLFSGRYSNVLEMRELDERRMRCSVAGEIPYIGKSIAVKHCSLDKILIKSKRRKHFESLTTVLPRQPRQISIALCVSPRESNGSESAHTLTPQIKHRNRTL